MATAQDRLNQILPSWYDLLTQWSLDGSLVAAATDALMLESSNAKQDAKGQLQSYVSQWSAGNFKTLPKIVLLSAEDISGARGAYADSTDTIYLNQEWLLSATEEEIQKVLTEELGHYLDDELNQRDSPGDEGYLFSYNLFNASIGDANRLLASADNDTIQIEAGGIVFKAEASSEIPAPDTSIQSAIINFPYDFSREKVYISINGVQYNISTYSGTPEQRAASFVQGLNSLGRTVSASISAADPLRVILYSNQVDASPFTIVDLDTSPYGRRIYVQYDNGQDDSSIGLSIRGYIKDILSPNGNEIVISEDLGADTEAIYAIIQRRWYSVDEAGSRTLISGENTTRLSASSYETKRFQYEVEYIDGELNNRVAQSAIYTSPAFDPDTSIQSAIINFPYDFSREKVYISINGVQYNISTYSGTPEQRAASFVQGLNSLGRTVSASISAADPLRVILYSNQVDASPFTIVDLDTSPYGRRIYVQYDNGQDDSSIGLSIRGYIKDILSPNGNEIVISEDLGADTEAIYAIIQRRWYSVDEAGSRILISGENTTRLSASSYETKRFQYEVEYIDGELNNRVAQSAIYTSPAFDPDTSIQSAIINFPYDFSREKVYISINGVQYNISTYSGTPEQRAASFVQGLNSLGRTVSASISAADPLRVILYSNQVDASPFTIVDLDTSPYGRRIYVQYDNGQDDSSIGLSIRGYIKDILSPNGNEIVISEDLGADTEAIYAIIQRRWYSVDEAGSRILISGENTTRLSASSYETKRFQYEVEYIDGELNNRVAQSAIYTSQAFLEPPDTTPPEFTSSSVAESIYENSAPGQLIYTANAADSDIVTYGLDLDAGNPEVFSISSDTGLVTLRIIPDYESNSSYSFTIVATDVAGNISRQSVELQVLDVNEAPTAVILANKVASLAENTATTSRIKVADIQITDDALGSNAVQLSGADAALFEADAGVLYLKAGAVLDFETNPSLDVTVSVADSTVAGSAPVTATYALAVTDVNEAPTAVILANKVASLAENTATTSRIKVADIQITDDALGSNAVQLSGADAALFEADAGVLYLKAGAVLDFETNPSLDVTVSVADSTVAGSAPVTATYALAVTDVNEAPTAVILANKVASLAENTATTSRIKVADIQITDDALGSNAVQLSGADAALFEADAGVLYLKAGAVLDFETNPSLDVTVSVADSTVAGSAPVTATYALAVTDVNEAPTAVILANKVASLAENTATTSRIKVADIQITDDALGSNSVQLSGADAALFEADAGVLYLKAGAVLDFETNPSLDVTVSVADSTVAGSAPVTATYALAVTDVNEAPTAVILANKVASLAENTATTSRIKVADIQITDDALGSNSVQLSGADAALFEADAGVLYLKAGAVLDFETNPSLDVTVSVADSTVAGSAPVTATYALAVTDVNEAPTAVILANKVASLAENTATTSRIKVADIQITDDALGSNAVQLSGADAALFEADAGVLYLKAGAVLDFETNPSLDVTVSVADSTVAGSAPVTATYALAVTDVNEVVVPVPTTGNDVLTATTSGGLISGVPSTDPTRGKGTKDKLTGNTGVDTFVLGNTTGVFYNDGITTNAGINDYGFISGFTVGTDKIQLAGSASQFRLNTATIADPATGISVSGVGIYLNDGTGSGSKSSAWDGKDELIGFVAGVTTTSLGSLSGSMFVYASTSSGPNIERTPVVGTTGNDGTLTSPFTGTSSNETFSLIGDSSNLGTGQFDYAKGNGGSDLFVLGDTRGVFYKDTSTTSAGTTDLLWITDFNVGDQVQLKGSSSNYRLNTNYSFGTANGTGIFLNDGSGSGSSKSGWDSKDELIGFLQGVYVASLTDTAQFIYVA